MTAALTAPSQDQLVDLEAATGHARAMLAALGIAGDDKTPARFVHALDQLAHARHREATTHLQVTFPPESDNPGLIVVDNIPFTALCEHHLLPFWGTAAVAYLPAPGQPIVGLSKLARLVRDVAARPQVQERIAEQVTTALHQQLKARGAACAMRSVHTCMALRGAAIGVDAAMTTVQYAGELDRDPWRREFTARLG